jgi:hypothetical protein
MIDHFSLSNIYIPTQVLTSFVNNQELISMGVHYCFKNTDENPKAKENKDKLL